MLKIEYLPGQDNEFADALSREERPRERENHGKDEYEIKESTHTAVRESRIETGDSSCEGGCGGTTSTGVEDRTSHPI